MISINIKENLDVIFIVLLSKTFVCLIHNDTLLSLFCKETYWIQTLNEESLLIDRALKCLISNTISDVFVATYLIIELHRGFFCIFWRFFFLKKSLLNNFNSLYYLLCSDWLSTVRWAPTCQMCRVKPTVL